MIVFDASSLVGAALKRSILPEQALLHAEQADVFALSAPVDAGVAEVLSRPKFAQVVSVARRECILGLLRFAAVWFEPALHITDCRDAKDDIYLELALAAGAEAIISSDNDLLTLHPWRGVSILRPADYLALHGFSGTSQPV